MVKGCNRTHYLVEVIFAWLFPGDTGQPCNICGIYCVEYKYFMMTSSNGNSSRVTGHSCGEFTGPRGEFTAQRPVTRGFDVFFDLRPDKQFKQSWGWWFETPSHSLWCHRNVRCMTWENTVFITITSHERHGDKSNIKKSTLLALCEGAGPPTLDDGFPSQRVYHTESVSTSRRHPIPLNVTMNACRMGFLCS